MSSLLVKKTACFGMSSGLVEKTAHLCWAVFLYWKLILKTDPEAEVNRNHKNAKIRMEVHSKHYRSVWTDPEDEFVSFLIAGFKPVS